MNQMYTEYGTEYGMYKKPQIFTHSEMTVRKHNVDNCAKAAKFILTELYGQDKINQRGVCVNALQKYTPGTLLTLYEFNEVTTKIVIDTEYHGGFIYGY